MTPLISVIIPVLHEEAGISGIVSHLRSLPGSDRIEIIVADGDAGGSTIRNISDSKVITTTSEPGRARQMNQAAVLASGRILLFLHADTTLPELALVRIESAVDQGPSPAGAFDLGIRSSRSIFRITERYVAVRTRVTRIPFGDQAIFIRRDYFESIGGFSDIPLMEDVEIMKRIRKRGDPICIIDEKVMTSPRRWEAEGILYCTLRNWALQIFYALGVSPDRLAGWYRSSRQKA